MASFLFSLPIVLYGLYIFWITKQWDVGQKQFLAHTVVKADERFVKFSIVIPHRNEWDGVEKLLKSLDQQIYPKDHFEVILVNDHSTEKKDKQRNEHPRLTQLHLSAAAHKSNKKEAIERGIAIAQHDHIVVTDADCLWQAHQLSTLNRHISEKEDYFILAPIGILASGNRWLTGLEQIDTAGMMWVTQAGIFSGRYHLANGAFMAYNKSLFTSIDPYADNRDIASGDDMFFVDKLSRCDHVNMTYLQNSENIVWTSANHSWRQFYYQRKRWARKNGFMKQDLLRLAMIIPFLCAASLFALAFYSAFCSKILSLFLTLCLVKMAIDLYFYVSFRQFFQLQLCVHRVLLYSLMHSLYVYIFGLFSLYSTKSDQWSPPKEGN